MKRTTRPAHCEPWSVTDVKELGTRLRLSRERLLASDLRNDGPAWRLWAACAGATFGYGREADQIYIATLADLACMKRQKAAPLMRRFDELGVYVWRAAPRGSHAISTLALPPPSSCAPVGTMTGSSCAPVGHMSAPTTDLHVPPGGTLQSNEVMSVEFMTHNSSIDGGTHQSSPRLSGSQGRGVGGSVAGQPFGAGTPGFDAEAWDAKVDAAWRAQDKRGQA
jgi:hypothetical protein